jgi:hypothetical protein
MTSFEDNVKQLIPAGYRTRDVTRLVIINTPERNRGLLDWLIRNPKEIMIVRNVPGTDAFISGLRVPVDTEYVLLIRDDFLHLPSTDTKYLGLVRRWVLEELADHCCICLEKTDTTVNCDICINAICHDCMNKQKEQFLTTGFEAFKCPVCRNQNAHLVQMSTAELLRRMQLA